MNGEVFYLKRLEVEQYQIPDVLRCILHTIMFNRALGPVRPRDMDSELFENITYMQCGDHDVEKTIEEKIDQFLRWSKKNPNKKGQVCLSFYEIKEAKIPWFHTKVERLDWEKWFVQLNVVQSPEARKKTFSDVEESSERHAALETGLRAVIMEILRNIDEKHNHVPPILNTERVPYLYEIKIPDYWESAFAVELFKRIWQAGPPSISGYL